jgi:hypothetical protein
MFRIIIPTDARFYQEFSFKMYVCSIILAYRILSVTRWTVSEDIHWDSVSQFTLAKKAFGAWKNFTKPHIKFLYMKQKY